MTGRRRLTRRQFAQLVETLEAGTTVVMEACSSAHYWGRRCQARGATVRLIPAHYVRPYVRRNKTDRADAEAILEAHRCGGIHPVPVKTVEQQTVQALHRIRQQWQTTRTARLNLIRGLLREHGVVFPAGAVTVQRRVAALVSDPESALAIPLRDALTAVLAEVRAIEQHLQAIDRQLQQIARTHPIAQRLLSVPGVGVITATALVGVVAHMPAFARGRHFASWVGLTPRETSSGHRRRLGRISKRGNPYLRTLLTHGGRAVLRAAEVRARQHPARLTRLDQWAVALAARRGRNRAAVALANKIARIIWAVWTRADDFVPRPVAA